MDIDCSVFLIGGNTRVPEGGVLTTSLLNGNGQSEIASGNTETLGNGQVFTSKDNGGLATVQGDQRTRAEGFGPSRGNVNVNGVADLLGSRGSRSTTFGRGNAGFLTGQGASSGLSSTEFNSFAAPTSSGGSVKSQSGSRGEFGSLSSAGFSLASQDP